MTGRQFLTKKTFQKFVRESESFDAFLQHVANFSIEKFVGHTYYPPEDRPNDTLIDTIELLLNAIIESGFETQHFDKLKAVVQ